MLRDPLHGVPSSSRGDSGIKKKEDAPIPKQATDVRTEADELLADMCETTIQPVAQPSQDAQMLPMKTAHVIPPTCTAVPNGSFPLFCFATQSK